MAIPGGAPPEILIDEDDEDKVCKSFHSIFSQHNRSQGLSRAKYPKTPKRLDSDAKRKEWKKMRGQFSGVAVESMYNEGSKMHSLFTVDSIHHRVR